MKWQRKFLFLENYLDHEQYFNQIWSLSDETIADERELKTESSANCWLLENEKWTRQCREWENIFFDSAEQSTRYCRDSRRKGRKKEGERTRRHNEGRIFCAWSRFPTVIIRVWFLSLCFALGVGIYVGSLAHFTHKKNAAAAAWLRC